MRWPLLLALLVMLALCNTASAQLLNFKSGHVKGQYLLGSYPDDSLLRDFIGTPSHDANADLRLLVDGRKNNWSWQGDYQLILRTGDTLDLSRQLQGSFLVPEATQNDDRRLMDLTHVISDHDDHILLQRMDRLHLNDEGYRLWAAELRPLLDAEWKEMTDRV